MGDSVLKSGCWTDQRLATEPNRNWLHVDHGCWLRELCNGPGCGCMLSGNLKDWLWTGHDQSFKVIDM